MIEKFNNIYYLLIYIIHFAGIGIYSFQTIFGTRKFCTKYQLDDTAFPMVRFVGAFMAGWVLMALYIFCLLYTSPSPRDATLSRMPSSA